MGLFRKTKTPRTKARFYPEGTFLHTEKGFFYVKSADKRFAFTSERVLKTWSPARVVEASESDPAVQRMKVGLTKMKFRNGSLVRNQYSGKMYLVSNSQLRHIVNPYWFDALGMSRDEALWVSDAEIKLHEMGDPLN